VKSIEAWLLSVLRELHARRFEDFSGLGMVFYTDRTSLPVHPLVTASCTPKLPAKTIEQAIDLLVTISRRGSVCHDGFHLVDANTLWITDVSQFLSPPIPAKPLVVGGTGGARHMAARLASLLSSVSVSVVWAGAPDVSIYERGAVHRMKVLS
jgi:hypothetical protein